MIERTFPAVWQAILFSQLAASRVQVPLPPQLELHQLPHLVGLEVSG
jgi:hypothetical protein